MREEPQSRRASARITGAVSGKEAAPESEPRQEQGGPGRRVHIPWVLDDLPERRQHTPDASTGDASTTPRKSARGDRPPWQGTIDRGRHPAAEANSAGVVQLLPLRRNGLELQRPGRIRPAAAPVAVLAALEDASDPKETSHRLGSSTGAGAENRLLQLRTLAVLTDPRGPPSPLKQPFRQTRALQPSSGPPTGLRLTRFEPPYTEPYVRWCGRNGPARARSYPMPFPTAQNAPERRSIFGASKHGMSDDRSPITDHRSLITDHCSLFGGWWVLSPAPFLPFTLSQRSIGQGNGSTSPRRAPSAGRRRCPRARGRYRHLRAC